VKLFVPHNCGINLWNTVFNVKYIALYNYAEGVILWLLYCYNSRFTITLCRFKTNAYRWLKFWTSGFWNALTIEKHVIELIHNIYMLTHMTIIWFVVPINVCSLNT
jgi:hypothetical protein